MATINIRIDDDLKKEAEKIFENLGLSLTAATNVYYRQVVRCGGIPFELMTDPFYSAENQRHLHKAIKDYKSGKSKPIIKSMAELEKMANE